MRHPQVTDTSFYTWDKTFVSCWEWVCPLCEQKNYAPDPDRAVGMYLRHVRDAHPEQQGRHFLSCQLGWA